MKSNIRKIILLYLIYAISIILTGWFDEELFGSIFFGIILEAFLVLCTLGMFIYALIYPFRCHFQTKRVHMISFVPLSIVVLTILAVILIPTEQAKVSVEHYLYQNLREKAIADIQSQQLSIDGRNVQLPLKYRLLSTDGKAYVFADTPEAAVVGFWVFRGMLSGSRLIVYNSNPVPPTPELLTCKEVQIIKQFTPHWYYLRMD